ncbi:MAG: aspartate kinase [Planctomycetota bacterium]
MVQVRDGVRVAKFGGTSVATAAQLLKVKAIIDADPRRRCIVVSAPGKAHAKDTKVTDLLYLAHELGSKGQPIDQVWNQIETRFLSIVQELKLSVDLKAVLSEAKERIQGGCTPDYAASRGEAIHGVICAALLGAAYVDAAKIVLFDRHGRLDSVRTYAAIKAACAGNGRVVVPGFYGSMPNGEVKTFSRGGSDVSGSIVANAVDAALYENWTDVSGFLMTDPRIVSEAKGIAEITYGELRELSYMGANVLHEEAVFPVREKGIPINIKNTNRPDDTGTLIVATRDPGHQVVVGIAGTKGFTVIALEKALMNGEIGFARKVLDVFASHQVSIEHLPTGIDSMSVVVSDKQLSNKLEDILSDLQAAVHPDSVKAMPGMALIATVGLGMNHAIGTAARLFTSLAKSRVNIRMIDQGSSEQNIIVGVEEADLATAIKTIYAEFA